MERRLSTGITGLDEVLYGGFLPERAYLIRGSPGAGKTILGLHFLLEGVKNNEPVLFITLSESEKSIRSNAERLNLPINGLTILDLSPESEFFIKIESYDIFSPAEVEREPITKKIVEEVERLKPKRVFIDSMTQFRYLATDVYQFRRQSLSFLRFLKEKEATVLFTSENSPEAPDEDLQFLSDGIIELNVDLEKGRTLKVLKFRGSNFRTGRHSCKITDNGMVVFPKILPEEKSFEHKREVISSGISGLDEMLKGGIERGTVTIITGPSGVGKTTLGAQFVKEASVRGENSCIYFFEENPDIFIQRCESIGMPVKAMLKKGTLKIQRVEPLIYTADEFAYQIRRDVEGIGARVVMIDSVGGYKISLKGEDLAASLHNLSRYFADSGVTVILINETETIAGEFKPTEQGISFIGDNIIFLRYLEINGELKKAIGVLKKRLSDFEKTLREFEITSNGIIIGQPLTKLRGILKGIPDLMD